MIEIQITCSQCQKSKPEKQFHKQGHMCKPCRRVYDRKYYQTNKLKRSEQIDIWQTVNKEQFEAKKKEWRNNNKEYFIKYFQDNKEKFNAYGRFRYKHDIKRRLRQSISRGMRRSLKGDKGHRHWQTLVNYTVDDLKKHLENQFDIHMSWGNYGEWEIDHIIPMSHFKITSIDCEGFKKCWALSNLRPYWKCDNRSENDRGWRKSIKNKA